MQQQKTKKKGEEEAIEEMTNLEKVSPHYKRIAAALQEVENLKLEEKKSEQRPSILLGDELTKFEGLLAKIQNHREIVNTFEIKIEELE